jgi:hypothetical protein
MTHLDLTGTPECLRMNLYARRVVPTVVAALVVAFPVSLAGAVAAPYPSTLTMQHGLLFSNAVSNIPKWGTELTAAEARWVTIKSASDVDRWGVWKMGGESETVAVRSVNGGVTWKVAGPMLATDWAGGGLYYVSKVFGEGLKNVVMVSNSVIDVSTDGGRQWYQYVNTADNWNIKSYSTSAGMELRVGGASYAQLPKDSYALYLFNVAHHQWHRIRLSMS